MTQERAHSLLVPMAASPSVAISSLMPQLPASCCARAVAKSVSRRSRTHQVRGCAFRSSLILIVPDMPEKEATYIITNGGINDPEKV